MDAVTVSRAKLTDPELGDKGLPMVSVIVPTFNRVATLAEVVRPLLADQGTAQLLVVVDGCDDGSFELLSRLSSTDPRLEPLFVENRGKQLACESALGAAKGEVVLLVDDDVVATPGLVTGHARHHARAPGQLVVGYTPVVSQLGGGLPDLPTSLYAAEYEKHCRAWEQEPGRVLTHLWGGNFSLRRVDCLEVGLWSPDFPDLYHEDQDFGIRCHRYGLRGLFDRNLLARHLHSRSLEQFLRDARSQGSGQVLTHNLHPDVLGPFDMGTFERDLPLPARLLLRACRRQVVEAVVSTGLRMARDVAHSARQAPLESAVVRLSRRISQQAGARQAIEALAQGQEGLARLSRRGGRTGPAPRRAPPSSPPPP